MKGENGGQTCNILFISLYIYNYKKKEANEITATRACRN